MGVTVTLVRPLEPHSTDPAHRRYRQARSHTSLRGRWADIKPAAGGAIPHASMVSGASVGFGFRPIMPSCDCVYGPRGDAMLPRSETFGSFVTLLGLAIVIKVAT